MADSETAQASHAVLDDGDGSKKKKNHNKYRRDKPWDTDDVDKWHVPAWNDKDDEKGDRLPGGRLLEESSFATLFPKYRETYLRHIWPVVTQALDKFHVACELNLVEGSMTVRTTSRTSDPYIILKARDLLKLLARSIPVAQAVQILQDEWVCDIVKIGGIVRNTQRFVKRRQRLIGHDGATLKALELVTGCYILVQGHTVSIMSKTYQGLKQARQVVLDCMNNIHPIYHIKRLMIQKELAQDPKLANEDWSRFLPTFAKKNVPRKKPKDKKNKNKTTNKPYTPFPPAPTPRKVDLQLDTGEYFATQEQRDANKIARKKQDAAAKSAAKRAAREVDDQPVKRKKMKHENKPDDTIDVDRIKAKLAKTVSKQDVPDASDYVDGKKKKKKSKKSKTAE